MKEQNGIVLEMDTAGIKRAVALLHAGEVVAFPTETVYGLGADATNDIAVARIFEAKQRPQFNPLIVHFTDAGAVWSETEPSETAKILADAFWPGPLTLVVQRKNDCRLSQLVSAGLESVAVRVPAHAGAQQLLNSTGRPLAAPSANRSGSISPTSAHHVFLSLGNKIPLILDGGACDVGLESTIVDVTGDRPVILRPGGISIDELQHAVGGTVERFSDGAKQNGNAPKSPGQLLSHYAPSAPVRLSAQNVEPGEVLLGFGPVDQAALNLSPSGDLVEAAANLFSMLHTLDAMHPSRIAVSPIPDTGLGEAINDRLQRASAPRS